MAGSITQEDREFVEVWEHVSPSRWGIKKLNARGEEIDEIIHGHKNFRLTTEERMITQDAIRLEKDDPFLNGSFRPVTVPDTITIATNPNALSDEEIKKILDSSDLAWKENLKQITSLATVRRMIEVAETHEGVTVARLRRLERKLVKVRGEARIDTKDPELKRFLSDRPSHKQTAASGDANPRRKSIGGGMSSDYR